ncbi:nucleoporin Nup186/Nup192/Nup205 [Dichotomopilus funicola]|uniref:Nucleoporin Nup186/Nup192/Nup205 n=1 Tax=Dichotomopilus funicola TaxID=1934379 RepID=A0AAN6V2R3_9PEZI|nr:nucleoporin Nup186/Nup192/Nup205 [Dichotomopilus funicola]
MSELRALEALQALHGELVAVRQHRYDGIPTFERLLEAQGNAFEKLIDKPPRNSAHRQTLGTGKVKIEDEEYAVNEDFVNDCLKVADDLDLDELAAARILLDCDAEGDPETQSRPLWECAIIRFHQERKYLLDCMRLMVEIASDEDLDPGLQDGFGIIAQEKVFGIPPPGSGAQASGKKAVTRIMEALQNVRAMVQGMAEKATARSLLQNAALVGAPENQETLDFSRSSLVEQHECLAAILHAAVEKRHVTVNDFQDFLRTLKRVDRYDHFLIHLFPVLAAYISVFGSTEGMGDLQQARQLNGLICKQSDDSWALPYLGAAVRAWWIVEHSGWYSDDTAYDLQGINLDEEDDERNKQFVEVLKEGAFDFILAVAADCRAQEWQDPSRLGMRQWLQRKSPPLASEPFPFSHFLQQSLMVHLEGFVEASISNLPDMLRKLRTEEDEQRQLSQTHEQDLDLERFLIIISYAYEGRPDAAMSFWDDPDSNLAGFLQWASTRASTPLVSAFCEMLQCLSDNEECATAAHNFLLDETHQASGKMKRSQSLTWSQIFRELDYFTKKLRDPTTPTSTNVIQRPVKSGADFSETEPESALMLECYLRLIAKLATESAVARQRMMNDEEMRLVEILFKLGDGPLSGRLRACIFYVLRALMTQKNAYDNDSLWRYVDAWATHTLPNPGGQQKTTYSGQPLGPEGHMEALLNELSDGFEESNAFIQLLTSLFAPLDGPEGLNDSLTFPEDLTTSVRAPGMEPYVDFVFRVFSQKSSEVADPAQLRATRLSCLEFAMTCLSTFNEDLIILGNESNIAIDVAMSTTDLATYVRFHPFARVMEWLFNEKVITALIRTIHQDPVSLGSASPDSPLVLSILRGIQVMIKALDLQETYLHLVRPVIEAESKRRRAPVTNSAFGTFEDGLLSHLGLVVDLGKYCNLGHGELTLACLKLLEKISTSPKIISAWGPDSHHHGHRNKAIVQLERGGEGQSIAASLAANASAPLDPALGPDSENYVVKLFIVDFIYECLKATPDQPTIAHLLLGFQCELNRLSVDPKGAFEGQSSLFHSLLNIIISISVHDEEHGMRGYLITLKYRILRIFQLLWKSPLSASLVMDELRATNFLFHMLMREVQILPDLRWDDLQAGNADFLLSNASIAYIDYLGARAMIFEYIGKELCSVSQNRIPSIKRRIFEALNGQIKMDGEESLSVANVFDFFDFLSLDANWDIPPVQLTFYKDLDLRPSAVEDPQAGLQYDIHKVRETIALKRNEFRDTVQLAPQQHLDAIEAEERLLEEYLTVTNRQKLFSASKLILLKSWVKLLLVMSEANDFKGTTKMSFLLQALQAILPSLEAHDSLSSAEALELARVAKVLLFKLDFDGDDNSASTAEKDKFTIGTLMSDKLFQLFQICLSSIGKWAGSSELRTLYYTICYRYLTAIVDKDMVAAAAGARTRGIVTARAKTLKAIQLHGDRLFNVICDDAYGSDTPCQTAATVLLSAFVHTSRRIGTADDDTTIIDALNRLNFLGVLVDSLKTILTDWLAIITPTTTTTVIPMTPHHHQTETEQYLTAKLALLLQIAQTRHGAKYILQANLFRALELAGVFAADPELQVDAGNIRALEKHYTLLVALARIVGAAVLARGAHNIVQGRRFLTQHRMLVVHVLKRSAGIGMVGGQGQGQGHGHGQGNGYGDSLLTSRSGRNTAADVEAQAALEERVEELAEAFMLLIAATGFLEFESGQVPAEKPRVNTTLFH